MTVPAGRRLASRAAWVVGAWIAVFAVGWLIFGWLFLQFPKIDDLDSYYHLAVAKLYAEQGTVDVMPWARFSALHDGFGDKEFLFHWLLAPFASGEDPAAGGRWALAMWNSLAVVVLGALGFRAAGRWGLLVPVVLWAGSFDFLGRLLRLRPETPALLLLVLAAWCFGTRRFRWLGLVAFVFTLSYTAFHALLGLVLAWFLWQAWRHRRAHWLGLAYAVVGTGLALLVHPHFPHNLLVWKLQSIDFFQLRHVLDVGAEIEAAATDSLLRLNLGWMAGFLLFTWAGLSRSPDPPASPESQQDRELADAFTLGALAFGGLLLLGRRFSTHALPFLLLALLFQLRAHGRCPGRRLLVPLRTGQWRSVPAWPLAALLLGGCLWSGGLGLARLANVDPRSSPEAHRIAFSQAMPQNARVAATWGHTALFAFLAPQGEYLNVLDPVFMAVPFPEVYRAQRRLFDSLEPDVPMSLATELDSQYLALVRSHSPASLLERLRFDPRMEVLHDGGSLLFRIRGGVAHFFVTDWRLVPPGASLPVAASESLASLPAYPLATDPALRGLEAYVDARRTGEMGLQATGRCRALVREEVVTERESRRYELAPWGPTTLWLDERPVARVQGTLRALLGRGIEFAVDLEPGSHRWTALTCRGEGFGDDVGDAMGFYLRQL